MSEQFWLSDEQVAGLPERIIIDSTHLKAHRTAVVVLLSQGQMSDHKGAGLLTDAPPPACELIADRGCDSDGLRAALEDLGITPCIPWRNNRKHPHDPALCRQRHPIESLFAKLKDWRRIATRCDRCANSFDDCSTGRQPQHEHQGLKVSLFEPNLPTKLCCLDRLSMTAERVQETSRDGFRALQLDPLPQTAGSALCGQTSDTAEAATC